MAPSVNTVTDTNKVLLCTVHNLTVDQGAALQHFLVQALAQEHPVSLACAQDIDLAGVQLLLAFSLERHKRGQPSFVLPLPEPVAHAFALAGCGDDSTMT